MIVLLRNNEVMPHAGRYLEARRHHLRVGIVVSRPAHCVERHFVCLVPFPRWAYGYPQIAPVVVRPTVVNGVLVDKVSALFVVCKVAGLKP